MQRYKLWDYFPGEQPLDGQLPSEVDFNKGLTIAPAKKHTFNRGELIETIHYAQSTLDASGQAQYFTPLVRETFVYYRDTMGFAYMRTQKIEWYNDAGELDTENTKTREKIYATLSDKRAEFVRRRRNQINALTDLVIGSLLIYAGMSPTQAVGLGSLFFKKIAGPQALFIEGNDGPLLDELNNATETWLDTELAPSYTLRHKILSELS